MANYQAIKLVCEGILKLLKDNYRMEGFNNKLN